MKIKIGAKIHNFEHANYFLLNNRHAHIERLMMISDDHSIIEFMDKSDIDFIFLKIYFYKN